MENDYPYFTDPYEINVDCDVIIDFSKPENIDHLLDYCVNHETAVVIATTYLAKHRKPKLLKLRIIFQSSVQVIHHLESMYCLT